MNKYLSAGALLVLGTSAAFAHITLETQEAAVGSTYKAVLRGTRHQAVAEEMIVRAARSEKRAAILLAVT